MNLPVDFHRLLPIVAVGAVALVAAVLVTRGVGGGTTTAGAQQVLDRAFKEEPRSGAVNMRVNFVLQSGDRQVTVAETVASGVGADTAVGKPAREYLHFSENVAGKDPVSFDKLSTGERGYIRVDGQWYRLSDAQYKRVFEPDKNQSFVDSLGFDPRRWVSDPKIESTNARVGGVAANQIVGDANPEVVLTDLGFYKSGNADSAEAQKFVDTIKNASKTGTMSLFAGKQDGILRKLSVNTVADASRSQPPIKASITFSLGVAKVNQPVKVVEPAGALPPSRIADIPRAKLGSQADDVFGAPTRSTGAGGRAKKQSKQAAGKPQAAKRSRQAYVTCVQSAQDLAALDRCQTLLP